MDGCDLIRAEREKQKAKWSADHDDGHVDGALVIEAALLATTHISVRLQDHWQNFVKDKWGLFQKHPDRIERLVIAGALIAAEIDRLQRLGET